MLQDKLQKFIDRFEEINELLIHPDTLSDIKRMTELSREQSGIKKVVYAESYRDMSGVEHLIENGIEVKHFEEK